MKITETQRRKGIVYSAVVYLGRGSNGKRLQRRVSATSKRELNRKIEELRVGSRRGLPTPPAQKTVSKILDEWLLDTAKDVAHRTLASYTDVVDTFLRPTIGHVRTRDLRPEHVRQALGEWERTPRRDVPQMRIQRIQRQKGTVFQGVVNGRRITGSTQAEVLKVMESLQRARGARETLSAATIRYILRVLRIGINWAVRTRELAYNPALAIKVPKVETYQGKVLSAEQFAILLQAAHDTGSQPLPYAIICAAATGLRRGEICALAWGDVDLTECALTVRRAIEVRRPIRGSIVVERLAQKQPKGERRGGEVSEQIVAIPSLLAAYLAEWRRSQARRLGQISPETPVFDAAGAVWHPDTFGKEFSLLIAASGLPRVRLHDLRHSFGSWLANAGVGQRVIQSQMRHKTAAMTNRYTTHVEEAQVAAAAQIDQLLRKAIPGCTVDTKLTQTAISGRNRKR